jgi:hypothetical protein
MASSILNSDDGVISGTSGLKSSGGDDGVLVFQSKGTETARINTDSQIVAAAGTASLPVITTTGDLNTGIFFPAADQVAVATNGAERVNLGNSATVFNDGGADVDFRVESDTVENALFVDGATGNIGAGVLPSNFASTRGAVEVGGKLVSSLALNSGISEIFFNAYFDGSSFRRRTADPSGYFNFNNAAAGGLVFSSAATGTAGDPITFTERMRIDSSGNLLVGKTAVSFGTAGFEYDASVKQLNLTTGSNSSLRINRLTNDGALVSFQQDSSEEGTISVSGTTVSYNGGHLSRWAQMLTKPDLLKGTVMSNLDEMNVYIAPTTYWTEDDELPEGVNVGDVKVETHEVENEQLNKVKVSDVEGDANVAGVFVNWCYDEAHQVDEINMAMTGDMIIRIAQGTTVARGDLLMSAGDGTAKPQGDDIVRSKTIAKVTSTHVTCTYDDGSYCVPCVLMAC